MANVVRTTTDRLAQLVDESGRMGLSLRSADDHSFPVLDPRKIVEPAIADKNGRQQFAARVFRFADAKKLDLRALAANAGLSRRMKKLPTRIYAMGAYTMNKFAIAFAAAGLMALAACGEKPADEAANATNVVENVIENAAMVMDNAANMTENAAENVANAM